MNIYRREFLAKTASAAAASALIGASGANMAHGEEERANVSKRSLPIIDTHQHLWDLSKFQPPWLEESPAVLNRSYVTKDYLKATEGLNLVKAVYMEVDVRPDRQVDEAEYITGLCRSTEHPTVAAVISGRPATETFEAYITKLSSNRYIKGVRQVLQGPQTPRGFCLGKTFVQSIRLLGKLGLSFDLCMRPAELSDGVKLATECPDTRFIVDHCGNADPKAFGPATRAASAGEPWHKAEPWKRDMAGLAGRKNVVCKISGIVARAATDDWKPEELAPIIDHCLEVFGPDRVMFGSDWPVCRLRSSLRRWVEALMLVIAQRPVEQQRRLLHDNAVKFYGLA